MISNLVFSFFMIIINSYNQALHPFQAFTSPLGNMIGKFSTKFLLFFYSKDCFDRSFWYGLIPDFVPVNTTLELIVCEDL